MSGELNLNKLISTMTPSMEEDVFVFCTVDPMTKLPPDVQPQATFREKEGLTLILKDTDAEKLELAFQAENLKLAYQYESRMITLNVLSSLEAVGFMAAIASKLADNGISVNPVSAFYHDHLFVPKDKADRAMILLKDLSCG